MDEHGSDLGLLAEYIAAFEHLDDLCAFGVPPALRIRADASGLEQWRPRQIPTVPSALEALYRGLGLSGQGSSQFPPLYETLVLSYRWAAVDLGTYRLWAKEPATDLSPLLSVMKADQHLSATLLPNGYLPFGQGPDTSYDPVCFDFRRRQRNGDCRIVRIDHEAILCYGRIRQTAELAPNFRSLVLQTIDSAVSHRLTRSDGTASDA